MKMPEEIKRLISIIYQNGGHWSTYIDEYKRFMFGTDLYNVCYAICLEDGISETDRKAASAIADDFRKYGVYDPEKENIDVPELFLEFADTVIQNRVVAGIFDEDDYYYNFVEPAMTAGLPVADVIPPVISLNAGGMDRAFSVSNEKALRGFIDFFEGING